MTLGHNSVRYIRSVGSVFISVQWQEGDLDEGRPMTLPSPSDQAPGSHEYARVLACLGWLILTQIECQPVTAALVFIA